MPRFTVIAARIDEPQRGRKIELGGPLKGKVALTNVSLVLGRIICDVHALSVLGGYGGINEDFVPVAGWREGEAENV
jgi:hypothetical protein